MVMGGGGRKRAARPFKLGALCWLHSFIGAHQSSACIERFPATSLEGPSHLSRVTGTTPGTLPDGSVLVGIAALLRALTLRARVCTIPQAHGIGPHARR